MSPYAQNIYCSIGFELSLEASRLGLLSIASGVALCRALKRYGFDNIGLKWPNDLVYDDGLQKYKLGGILIESRPLDKGYFVVVGFGLNVHMNRSLLDEIPQPAASLAQISKASLQRQDILFCLITSITSRLGAFPHTAVDDLLQEYSAYDAYLNQPVTVIHGEEKVNGTCLGIDIDGQLIVKTVGAVEKFSAAEISLRAHSDVVA